MTIMLGFSKASAPSAARIVAAGEGKIDAIQRDGDINWGRRRSTGLNADISNSVNKRRARELFEDNGVPAPKLFGPTDAEMLVCAEAPMVGRPDFHTRGRGFWLCRTPEDVRKALRGTRRKLAATHFMEFVPAPKEFRVHVFMGDSIRMSQKQFVEDTKDYTTVKPDPDLPKRHIRNAAKAAVEAVGLDFGAVDLLASEDQTQVWVLEVNAAPGLGGSTPRLWAKTFINYMEGREQS